MNRRNFLKRFAVISGFLPFSHFAVLPDVETTTILVSKDGEKRWADETVRLFRQDNLMWWVSDAGTVGFSSDGGYSWQLQEHIHNADELLPLMPFWPMSEDAVILLDTDRHVF